MGVGGFVDKFHGLRVFDYMPARGLARNAVPRIICEENRSKEYQDVSKTFETLRADSLASELKAIVIGPYAEAWDGDATKVLGELCSAASQRAFGALEAVFLGDIPADYQEISWITVGNAGVLLDAWPQLKSYQVRGTTKFEFTCKRHTSLQRLVIESGGLNQGVVQSILATEFPALEHLELWLGDENYGADHSVKDFMPLFSGRLFPALRSLGLRNCAYTDDLAVSIADAPILRQLERLDFSMGTLGDLGGEALASSPLVAGLKSLDVRHHFLSPAVSAKLARCGPSVLAGEPEREEDERYIQVSE
ncbi:MAG: hypothetical protein Q8Q09_21090 [Deltaproteobacteria bacterium]|nr:hypothetical protein [Deltaproteobacteria bacterium]